MIQLNKFVVWFLPVLFIAILGIVGCSIVGKNEEDQGGKHEEARGFSHKVHAEGGIACKSCHVKASKSAEAGMPNEMLCGFCHETVYDDQPVGEIYNKEKWLLSYKTSRRKYEEVNMSHQQHMSVGVECADCHGNVAGSVKVTLEHVPVKETCSLCHKEVNSADKCDTCHKEIRYDTPPYTHKNSNFKRIHGQLYREESIRPDKSLEIIPSCSRCHSNDYCVNCHQNEAPVNHSNQWGSPKHNHCQRCHIPIATSVRCKPCHDSAPAHLSDAPTRPEDLPHRRPLMCRACHSSGGSNLKHADNGLDCRLCHKL